MNERAFWERQIVSAVLLVIFFAVWGVMRLLGCAG